MSITELRNGSQIAAGPLESSVNCTDSALKPTSLSMLLSILERDPPKSLPMLRSTASKIAEFYGARIDDISFDRVYQMRGQFRRYLETRRYTENSIRSYVNYVRILIQKARSFGWFPGQNLPAEWQQLSALAHKRKCTDAVHYLAQVRKSPKDVTVEDVDCWVEVRLQEGISYELLRDKKGRFWRLLRDSGWTSHVPASIRRVRNYGLSFGEFPQELMNEVDRLLRWKTAEFSPDRPKGAQIRTVTADKIRAKICHLLGYAINIRGLSEIISLQQLVTKEIVSDYVAWCINERGVKGKSLQVHLGRLDVAMRQHPSYSSLNLRWFKTLLQSLPIEPESERRMRKARKYLEYAIAEAIPGKICVERMSAERDDPYQAAVLAMEELLMRLLITLAWRQRNMRECRIGGPRPNLFKAKIPSYIWVDKPSWVQNEERNNPEATFWQLYFTPDEIKTGSKTGKEIHAVLPRPLIRPLEEYLAEFRPRLTRNGDPGTLFVKKDGTALSDKNVTGLVERLSFQYGGKRVNPHLYRDIVAFAWLKEHPKDYLTLSKILWHANINYTIKVYGSQFDESSGVCAMESWIEEREAKEK